MNCISLDSQILIFPPRKEEKSNFQWDQQLTQLNPKPHGHQCWPRQKLALKSHVKSAQQFSVFCTLKSHCNSDCRACSCPGHGHPETCPKKIILLPCRISPRWDLSWEAGHYSLCRSHFLQSRLQAELGLRPPSLSSPWSSASEREEFRIHKDIKRKHCRASITPWDRLPGEGAELYVVIPSPGTAHA